MILARVFTDSATRVRGVPAGSLMLLIFVGLPSNAPGQATSGPVPSFKIPSTAMESDAALDTFMPALAAQVLAKYSNRISRQATYLNNLFQMQVVAGRYDDACKSLDLLSELHRSPGDPWTANYLQWVAYSKAKALQLSSKIEFEDAFRGSFRELMAGLDNINACHALYAFLSLFESIQFQMRQACDQQKGKTEISFPDAVNLILAYHDLRAAREFHPLVTELTREDDAKRYEVEPDLLVHAPDGTQVSVLLIRPRSVPAKLPTLLHFTIYAAANDMDNYQEARETAAHGYAGAIGFTRGKRNSPGNTVPYEHDGADAAAVIDWLGRQPWSDGRVGMYGGSYTGFTQWAAVKHFPAALKAIMPSVTGAPGIDTPMEGNVFRTFVYQWAPYTTNNKTLDDATYNDRARWDSMNQTWYKTGQPYRSLDRIDGTPNPVWDRWLDHPTYDSYWQRMIPYRGEFAKINIPVLTTTGYFDGAQIGAPYYFREHQKYNTHADHYLVIGPYNHFGAQRRSASCHRRLYNC